MGDHDDGMPASSMYPDVSPIALTHREFPNTFDSLEKAGLPLAARFGPSWVAVTNLVML